MRCIVAFVIFSMAASAAGLTVTRAAVEQYEDGPPASRQESFAAGEVVHFDFQVEGFARAQDQVSLSFEAQPADSTGVPLTPPVAGEIRSTLGPEDKDWTPKLRGRFTLPGILLPGEYRISILLKDEVAATAASNELTFSVSGPPIEPSAFLKIGNFHFYLNEDDEQFLEKAVFRPGEEIHARFAIIGFRHDTKGTIDVGYGISITDSSGHVLFENTAAANDKGAEFYPKPYVPGIVAFSLKAGTPKGEYTLRVRARDSIGDQRADDSRPFRLE